ncbi:cytochrome [Bordetella genomosp. 9]|uniref:c-type cytochrome n=1 Tax=Bordetella genomosp. 9 TaxID=1416803 RepID=UPI000A28F88D|nr:cytochrome c [Bordetella genomosp. 9]ARP89683.1 cytochrome [Bordetella genomosp. 9]
MKRTIVTLAGVLLGAAATVSQAGDLDAGKAVYQKFNCASCHGADAKTPTDPSYPILAGQHEDFLRHALTAYKRGQSGAAPTANIRKNPIMGAFAAQLSDTDIDNVAAWLASQPSDLGSRK